MAGTQVNDGASQNTARRIIARIKDRSKMRFGNVCGKAGAVMKEKRQSQSAEERA